MHIIYRRPREPWAALGKTRVSNKCFEKCPFFGTFTTLKVLKEIIISIRDYSSLFIPEVLWLLGFLFLLFLSAVMTYNQSIEK